MSDENQLLVDQSSNGNVDHQRQTANGSTSQQQWISDVIRSADANDIQQVAASNLNLNDRYCQSIIRQANRSFWSALISASVGLVVFLSGAIFLVFSKQDAVQVTLITSLGAAITTFISGTSFYLYTHAMRHFEAFHLCLARTEIVLLENSICKQIEDQTRRDAAYASVVENIESLAVLITSYGQKSQGTTDKKSQGTKNDEARSS